MSFPRYPKYKDSGVEWLGEVPEHWEMLRLKFLFELKKRSPEDGLGIVTCFRDGIVTLRSNRRTDGFTNSDKEIGYQTVRVGDLVIHAMDAFAGAIGVADSDGKSSPVYSVCVPATSSINQFYYARLLRNMALSGFISSLAKGIRERSTEFRWSDASEVMLPVPPLDEQTRIAEFLDRETGRMDALIEEQKRLIELLKEKRQALISHVVTKGLNPDAPMKDSGVEWLGQVPKHWEVCTFRRLIESAINGTTIDQNEESESAIPVSRIETISTGIINFEKVGWVEKNLVDAKYLLQPKDILFSHINSLSMIGNCALYEGKAPLVHGMNLLRIRVRNQIDSNWVYYWLIQRGYRNEIESRAKPAINQASISTGSLKSTPAILVPLTEQIRIAAFLDREITRIDALTSVAEKAIALMQERRSALISAAVTGKIKVA